METYTVTPEINPISKWAQFKKYFYVLLFVVGIFATYIFCISAPSTFPEGAIVNIEQGSSLRAVSFKLQRANIIRSRIIFETFAIMYGGEKRLVPGDYLFEHSSPVFDISRRIAKGERDLAPIKVTIPEGYNLSEMGNAFAFKLSNFNKENFLAQAKYKEGYLFPDTYFFFSTDTEKEVIKAMSTNFEKKMSQVRPSISSSGKSEKDIIVMASIIEKEAKGDDDRELISGILWKRISINMALQVDAAPDTYKKRGLPENPIANPGLKAINAAINPKSSSYLYYLHEKSGAIHYAASFDEHKRNIAKYLR